VPVDGTDAHLDPLQAERLTPLALRERFARLQPWLPELPGDGHLYGGRDASAAAVLVPLVQRDDGLHVLLTRRTDHLRDHAGQISFPGGRAEPHDADAAATALREAEEEVGAAARARRVIGHMPAYTTVTLRRHAGGGAGAAAVRAGARRLRGGRGLRGAAAFLMTPAHHRRHVFELRRHARQFLSMPWHGPGADGVEREYFIWGATAAMLRNLYRFLARLTARSVVIIGR
jgi:8-oxo-dGTP pyrophosphatase MutT (NUDIX family)